MDLLQAEPGDLHDQPTARFGSEWGQWHPERPTPTTRYARSGDVSIAYQVVGDGPVDLVCVPGLYSHTEFQWTSPAWARYLQDLGSFARLILFDKRGTGLSDRDVGVP